MLYNLQLLNVFFVLAQAQTTTYLHRCNNANSTSLQTIECTRPDRAEIKITAASNLTKISNCRFVNCGPVRAQVALTFENVVFDSFAGGVFIAEQHVTILQSVFQHCSNRGGAKDNVSGGMTVQAGATVTVSNSTFRNCTSNRATDLGGGAFCVLKNAAVNISDTVFMDSRSDARGGSLYVEGFAQLNNATFYRGRAPTSRGGDAYAFDGGVLVWNGGASYGLNGDFNTVQTAGGGGSVAAMSSRVNISHVVFEGQRVAYHGGAIRLDGGSSFIYNVTIRNSYASMMGGAFAIGTGEKSTLWDSTIIGSMAGEAGGSLSVADPNTVLLVRNLVIQSSTANSTAGCLFMSSEVTVMIQDSVFDSCRVLAAPETDGSAEGAGGGVMMSQSLLTLNNVTFSSCRSKLGGAMAVTYHGKLEMERVVFQDNQVTSYGGAIYLADVDCVAKDIVFKNNRAGIDGGGIQLVADLGQVPMTFTGSLTMVNNTANRRGGGLSALGHQLLYFNTTDMTILNNTAAIGAAMDFRITRANQCCREKPITEGCAAVPWGSAEECKACKVNKALVPEKDGQVGFYPQVDDTTRYRVEGIVWFDDDKFSSYAGCLQLFSRYDIPVESNPIQPRIVNLPSVANNTALDMNFKLPDIQVELVNAFSKPLPFNKISPPIISAVIKTSDGLELYKAYKGMLYEGQSVVTFANVVLPRVVSNYSGSVVVTFKYVSADTVDRQAVLEYQLPRCVAPGNIVIMTGKGRNNKPLYACVPTVSTSFSIKLAMTVISCIFGLMTVGLLIFSYIHRTLAVYLASSIIFTNCIAVGSLLQFMSVALMAWNTSYKCMLTESLELIGFTLLLVSSILKMYRIEAIFVHTLETKTTRITNKFLLLLLGIATVLAILFIALWIVFEPMTPTTYSVGGAKGWIQTDRCTSGSSDIFPTISLVLHLGLEVIAVILAYKVRQVPSQFNESKAMASISYSWIICSGILYPIAQFLPLQPDVLYLLHSTRIALPSAMSVFLLHIPKAYLVLTDFATASQRATLFFHSDMQQKSEDTSSIIDRSNRNSEARPSSSLPHQGRPSAGNRNSVYNERKSVTNRNSVYNEGRNSVNNRNSIHSPGPGSDAHPPEYSS